MKFHFTILFFFVSFYATAQGPQLQLKGSNFSYAKGNIEVEVLTELIEQKQREIAQRLFKNGIVSYFKDVNKQERSLITYTMAYNIMNSITTEKNKTVITRQIINTLLEYAIINAFAHDFIIKYNIQEGGKGLISVLSTYPSVKGETKYFLKDLDRKEWETYNVILDKTFKLFLEDQSANSFKKYGLFKALVNNPGYDTWYSENNADNIVANYPSLQGDILAHYTSFMAAQSSIADLYTITKDLINSDFQTERITLDQFNQLKASIKSVISILSTYENNNTVASIINIILEYTLIEIAPVSTQPNILYIDAEGLISTIFDHFLLEKSNKIYQYKFFTLIPRPFINIGVNHSATLNSSRNNLIIENGVASNLKTIYYASEKIGIKFTGFDRKYTHSFEPGEEFKYKGKSRYWKRPQTEPSISRVEFYLYGSGLLYNVVNIKSERNFDYSLVGGSVGIYFFNGLMLNVGASLPITAKNDLKSKWMANLSLDVPIIDYINALKNK